MSYRSSTIQGGRFQLPDKFKIPIGIAPQLPMKPIPFFPLLKGGCPYCHGMCGGGLLLGGQDPYLIEESIHIPDEDLLHRDVSLELPHIQPGFNPAGIDMAKLRGNFDEAPQVPQPRMKAPYKFVQRQKMIPPRVPYVPLNYAMQGDALGQKYPRLSVNELRQYEGIRPEMPFNQSRYQMAN